MKSYQLSDILFIILKKIVYVNEKKQSFANRNAIFWLFSIPLMTRWHINWYYYVQKAPEQYPANRKRPS